MNPPSTPGDEGHATAGASSSVASHASTSPPAIPSHAAVTPPEPITLGEIAHEFREDYLQWHSGALGTLLDLFVHPCRVARSYLVERDDRYVRPLRYLLVSIAATIAANWFVVEKLHIRSQLGVSEIALQHSSFLLSHDELLTLLELPILAAIMRCIFHGLRVRFVDALVVLAYTQAQVNLVGLASLALLVTTGSDRSQWPITVAMAVYMIWAWADFAEGPAWRRWLSAIATLALGQWLNLLVVKVALALA